MDNDGDMLHNGSHHEREAKAHGFWQLQGLRQRKSGGMKNSLVEPEEEGLPTQNHRTDQYCRSDSQLDTFPRPRMEKGPAIKSRL